MITHTTGEYKAGTFCIDMQQFRREFRVYADNVRVFEAINRTAGQFFTLDARPYMAALNDCKVFYTFQPSR